MSASKCIILFVVIAQLADNLVVKGIPVGENNNAQAFTNYRYDNPYLKAGQNERGFGVSNWRGYKPMPIPGGIEPGFDIDSGYVPIGTGYIPAPGGGSTGFDPGFDGSGSNGGFGSGGFVGIPNYQLVGKPSVGFGGSFDGSHLGGS